MTLLSTQISKIWKIRTRIKRLVPPKFWDESYYAMSWEEVKWKPRRFVDRQSTAVRLNLQSD